MDRDKRFLGALVELVITWALYLYMSDVDLRPVRMRLWRCLAMGGWKVAETSGRMAMRAELEYAKDAG